MPNIAVINESTTESDTDVFGWVNAIQQQLLQDVAPFWPEAGTANLFAVPQNQRPPLNAWQVVLVDDATLADALGFHEMTQASLPLAKVFTVRTRTAQQTVSRVLSHEVVEMVVNPNVLRRQTIGADTYLVETADPVHLDRLGYEKLGVLVSNFVTPDYYRYTNGNRYDMRALLPGPCPTLLSGGVLSRITNGQFQLLQAPNSTPQEIEAMGVAPGSRRDRWQMGHQNWRNSLR